jgi:hypothetical protein
MPRPRPAAKTTNSADIGFEAKLWLAADKLRSNMDAAEYKHVVIDLTATPSKQTNGLFNQNLVSGSSSRDILLPTAAIGTWRDGCVAENAKAVYRANPRFYV